MMGSIRLFLASLFIAQLSGVVGSRSDNGHNRKDQLRGHGREENRNMKEEVKHSSRIGEASATSSKDQTNKADTTERDLQEGYDYVAWQDDQGFGSNGYDDYFGGPSDSLAYTGNQADDHFFTDTSNSNQHYVGYDDTYDDYFSNPSGAHENVEQRYYDSKGGKSGKDHYSGKGGKGYYGKSGKSAKHGKHGKSNSYYGSKGGNAHYKDYKNSKSSKGGVYHYDYAGYDDHTAMDDIFYFQPVPAAKTEIHHYDDYTNFDDYGAWSTSHDDFFDEAMSGSSSTRSYNSGSNNGVGARVGGGNNGNGNQGRTSTGESYYDDDDDFFNVDKQVFFLPRPTVSIGGNFFSVNPNLITDPVVPDNTQNSLTLGTEYLWDDQLSDATNINSNLIPITVDNEIVNFYFAIDGYCVRIGGADQNSVQGYCFFTYTAIDPTTGVISGSFTAQGIIVNAEVPGQLTVSGGTGIMTGATGLVEILPAALDENFFPPLLIQPPLGADPFNDVAGWAHYFEVEVDILFFLPELYAPARQNRS